jgi:copper chaperone CopZ
VRSALKPLPGVEQDSIKVDIKTKEVTFALKDKSKYDGKAVKEAIEKAGYKVAEVKSAPKT